MTANRFNLHDKVKISTSGETGEVIGLAEYAFATPQALVRYCAGDGRATECWWNIDALEAA